MKQELETNQKIAIMGGTFDPIHNGHLQIALAAYHQYALDAVWFMPTGRPPHKEGRTHVSDAHRERMTQLAIAGHPFFHYSDLEIRQGAVTYTADTLTALTEQYPHTVFYYIVGSDSLCYMDKWYHPERIFAKAVILAACRNTQNQEETEAYRKFLTEKFHADIRMVFNAIIPVSSTQLRKRCGEQLPLEGLVPPAVEAYIRENHLYGRKP